MAALVVFVERVAFCGAEGGKVVASEDTRLETACGEESEDAFEVIEKCVFVAVLDGEVEDVFATRVPKGEKLFVPFYTWWVDGADVVVAYTFADFPQ